MKIMRLLICMVLFIAAQGLGAVCHAGDISVSGNSTTIEGYSTTLLLNHPLNFTENNQNDQSIGSPFVVSKNQYFYGQQYPPVRMNITRIVYNMDNISQVLGYEVDRWKYATAEYDSIFDILKQRYPMSRFSRHSISVDGNNAWLYDVAYEDTFNGRKIPVKGYSVMVCKGIEVWMVGIDYFNEEAQALALNILENLRIM